MKSVPRLLGLALIATLGTALGAAPAAAYIGPGAGLTAIGTVLALIGALLLAIFGFVWYPLKRLMQKRKKKRAKAK